MYIFDLTDKVQCGRLSEYEGYEYALKLGLLDYLPGAFVPVGKLKEIVMPKGVKDWSLGYSIAIVKYCESECASLRKKYIDFLNEDVGYSDLESCLSHFLGMMDNIISFSGTIHPLGFVNTNDSGPTLTKDFGKNEKVGLHIDNWTKSPLDARGLESNRFVINLGPGKRRFIYLNASVAELSNSYYQKLKRVPKNTLEITKAMEIFREEYKLRSILLNPGEAYIAPTENCIHDANTIDNHENTTFMLRGNISPRLK